MFREAVGILRRLVLHVLLTRVDVLYEGAPVGARTVVGGESTAVDLEIVGLVALSVTTGTERSFCTMGATGNGSVSVVSLSSIAGFVFTFLRTSVVARSPWSARMPVRRVGLSASAA